MRKLTLLICIGLACTLQAAAQWPPDSMRTIINESSVYKTKIETWISLLGWYELKNFDTTLEEGGRAIELARTFHDSVSIARIRRHIGVARYFKGNYEEAARDYYAAIAILEKTPEKRELANTYNELAKLFRKTRDLSQALANYNKAESIFRQLRDSSGIAMILNESGVVFEYQENYTEAQNRYRASMELAMLTGDSLSVSYSLSNLAGVDLIRGHYDMAENELLRALHIREGLRDSFAIALTYTDLGVAMSTKGDYAKAARYLSMSNEKAMRLNYPELLSNNYNELASVSEKQGDYKNAYEYYKKRTALRDSLFGIEKTKQIGELNARYETSRKEQQIQQQQARIRLQNYLFIGIAGLILLAALLLQTQYRKSKLRQEARMKTELLNQQEAAVKAVLEAEENERQRIARDLHDGVGQMMSAAKMNLSAFESNIAFPEKAQQENFQKIISLVDESCREVRNVSHLMMPTVLQKNDLGAAVREFVNKLSHKNLAVEVYTEGLENRMDPTTETVLYRVIQECVNNVIKHAGATTLDISLTRDELELSGTIEDNGKGFDAADPSKYEGLGLKNIATRIGYLRGSIDIDSAPGRGTLIAFHIPLTPVNPV